MGDILSSYEERQEDPRHYRKSEEAITQLNRISNEIRKIQPLSEEYEQIVFLIDNIDKIWRNRELIKILG